MYKIDDFDRELYRVGEVAELLGVSAQTVHNMDKKGVLKPAGRTNGGQRLYAREEVLRYLRESGMLDDAIDVIYTKGVTAAAHENQVQDILDKFTVNTGFECIHEDGSNKGLLKLLRMVFDGKVRKIYVMEVGYLSVELVKYIKLVGTEVEYG